MPPFSVPIEQIQTLGCELEVCGNRLDLYAVSDQDADPNRLKPLLTVLRNHKTQDRSRGVVAEAHPGKDRAGARYSNGTEHSVATFYGCYRRGCELQRPGLTLRSVKVWTN